MIIKDELLHKAWRLTVPHSWDGKTASAEENIEWSRGTEADVTGVQQGAGDGGTLKR